MVIRYYLKNLIPLVLLFAVVYHFCNWFNSVRDFHFPLYFQWELSAPLWSWTMPVYISVYVLLFLPAFYLNKQQLQVLKKKIRAAIIIGGIFFIMVPTKLGFIRTEETDHFNGLFQLMYVMDKPYNCFPSLHITLSLLLILALIENRRSQVVLLYAIWMLCIMVSVISVHQHHLMDIVGGIILATAVTIYYKRKANQLNK